VSKHEVYHSQRASDGRIAHKDSHCSREAAGTDSNQGQGQNLLLGVPASVLPFGVTRGLILCHILTYILLRVELPT
jgi:hypothetical protein